MRFLEDKYRTQGYAQGYLDENQYVRFSEQAHGKTMINFCRDHPEKCPDTPTAGGDATDGYPLWLHFENQWIGDKLVPDMASCPYVVE